MAGAFLYSAALPGPTHLVGHYIIQSAVSNATPSLIFPDKLQCCHHTFLGKTIQGCH